jgi:adenylate cyclase class 1
LKEEFYRTFVLIAGQIPFWAVLPVGLKDAEYMAWVKTAGALSDEGFSPDDYVDLGNLTSIEREEFYGSLLWQFCKAQDDPAKALIKTSLMAQHFFSQEREGLLCDVTKRKFPECRLDSYVLDPYALAFDRVLKFYEDSGDESGLEIIRKCIYLRIVGYPVPFRLEAGNPKTQLIRRYVKEWSWGDNRIERLQSYASWPENERLKFERSIIAKLWDLYRQIVRSTERPGGQMGMTSEDLAALRNKAASRFKKKHGKIPYASMYVRTQEDSFPVVVACQKEDSGDNSWTVYDGAVKGSLHKDAALFAAPELVCVLGWIVFNGLYNEKLSTVDFKRFLSPISPKRAKQLLDEVSFFLSNRVSTRNYHSEPRWLKVFVALDTSRFPSDGRLLSADYLIQNTWGEVFFRSSDLRHIENKLLKYHEIAKQIWEYLQDADPEHSSYQVVDLRTVADPTTAETIKASFDDLQRTAAERVDPGQTRPKEKSKHIETQKGGVILDLF